MLDLQESREVGSGLSWSFGCFSTVLNAVFVTLLRTAVETAVSEVHRLLRTGGVPTSLTLLLLLWLMVSLRVGARGRAIYAPHPTPPHTRAPLSSSLISRMFSVDVKHRVSCHPECDNMWG